MARINQLRPEHIVNEVMTHNDVEQNAENNFWKTQKRFIPSSLEVFWNGQKLLSNDSENGIDHDYEIISDQTIKVIGADVGDNDKIVKQDHFVCNYLVKI